MLTILRKSGITRTAAGDSDIIRRHRKPCAGSGYSFANVEPTANAEFPIARTVCSTAHKTVRRTLCKAKNYTAAARSRSRIAAATRNKRKNA